MYLEKKAMTNKVILITGGTGSWGQELTERLLGEDIKEIRILSRNEFLQVAMERKFNDKRIKFYIGDIRDSKAVEKSMQGVDYVFHLAALKHVPVCEKHPMEAILTNIVGTQNVIEVAINKQVKKVIYVSTDKAVDSYNLYGETKAVGEKLIIHANTLTKDTRFVCVRAGNVLASTGSVIPFFINQLKQENRVTLTDEKMTRYFISNKEAIDLLVGVVEKSFGGEIYVMDMPSFLLIDLVHILIRYFGNEQSRIEHIGVREGEKLYEELISKHEINHTYKYGRNYYLIAPAIELEGFNSYYNDFKDYEKVHQSSFTSSDQVLDQQVLEKLLKDTGCI